VVAMVVEFIVVKRRYDYGSYIGHFIASDRLFNNY
jgi:hypothetical protein